ncbi:hypothetical protein CEE37_14010 [candidate division LCP-89 bacterium B3_LCP]|uniref:Uncharacterized protein n=1 Tax=candidate division LCP-89 bacterium B3_LCP TaxID=2012998 RepID=A0A532URS7_UNCL8|nr:MAG: hypothetical protein CEE37_14010 [candidate division LCP-89 bacterium B3_LCP]
MPRPYKAPINIKHLQLHQTRDWHSETDSRSRVEGIGVLVVACCGDVKVFGIDWNVEQKQKQG